MPTRPFKLIKRELEPLLWGGGVVAIPANEEFDGTVLHDGLETRNECPEGGAPSGVVGLFRTAEAARTLGVSARVVQVGQRELGADRQLLIRQRAKIECSRGWIPGDFGEGPIGSDIDA